jgi:hypothetical protein
VTAVRTFSMSTGLLASTVTPGSTAPDVSVTAPAIVACAQSTVGAKTANATIAVTRTLVRITHLVMNRLMSLPNEIRCSVIKRSLSSSAEQGLGNVPRILAISESGVQ